MTTQLHKKTHNGMIYRFQPVIAKPGTLDEATRSVEVVGATETPSQVWDPERWEIVTETLLMSGCEIPDDRQVPLTIDHDTSVEDVIGSFTDMITAGDQLTGRVVFSSSSDADPFWIKVKEGHLKNFSITYPASGRESVYIEDGTTAVVDGKSYTGPLLVTKRWQPKALGLVLYPADDRATARNQPELQETTMDPRLRAFLERHGLSPNATDEEAWAHMDKIGSTPLGRASEGSKSHTESASKEIEGDNLSRGAGTENIVRVIERERISEIMALCQRFEIPADERDKLVGNGTPIDSARQFVLEYLERKRQAAPQPSPGFSPSVVTSDGVDKFRAAAEDGLLMRSGIKVDKPTAGAQDVAGWSMLEMARHSLVLANKPSGGHKMEMVGRALTATDFPMLLANVANKSLFIGWETAQETWQQWCAVGSVSDFKPNYLPRISETDDLDEIPEGMEYKYGKRLEQQETFAIATYGKLIAITRKAIIDDDLSALTDVPKGHGEAAARKIGDLPYAVLTANAAMGDGNALFCAAHKNYVASGSGAVPGVSSLAAAILAMGTQKDLQGMRRLNIQPRYFIAPRALQGAAEVFFMSDRWSDVTANTDASFAATRVNPYSGNVYQRVYESRLDDIDESAWYMSAAQGRSVKVFFLDGQQRPYMEIQQGWEVDGVEYKVRIDAGAKAVDWRGLYSNAGK
jgi:hypothetical protein